MEVQILKKISIIIPLYNKEPHIKRTILSVLSQTYKYFELIVVDDGSTDKGLEIVKSFKDERIKIFEQVNSGVSSARNKGIDEASYELISFLDADDEWSSVFLEKFIKIINKYPKVGMIGSSYFIIGMDEKKIVPKFYDVPMKDGIIENYFKAAIKKNPTWSSTVMVHKKVFNKIGGFPIDLSRGEDSYMWNKIALHYTIAFINEPLATRHHDAVNRVSSNDNLIDDFPLFDYIKKSNIVLEEQTAYYVNEYVYKKYLSRATQCLRVGKKGEAEEFIFKAKNTKLFKKRYLKLKVIKYFPTSILLNTLKIKKHYQNKKLFISHF